MISRGFAWIDESIERSDADDARATALAKRWSALQSDAENRRFTRDADIDDGRDCDLETEPCEDCGGDGFLGLDGQRSRRYGELVKKDWMVGIKCPNLNCEDGQDMGPRREYEKLERERQAERDLDIELVEDKLARLGARMMRPYEHHDEDERYMEYMETRYDGEY